VNGKEVASIRTIFRCRTGLGLSMFQNKPCFDGYFIKKVQSSQNSQ